MGESGGKVTDPSDDSLWQSTFYHYESELSRIAVNWSAIEGDLEEAQRALGEIDDSDAAPESFVVHRALWNYAVVLYSRLFAKGGRRPRLDAQLKAVFGAWPDDRGVHEHIVGVRNKHLAHPTSDMEQWGTAIEIGEHPAGASRMRAMGLVVSAAGPVEPAIAQGFRSLVGHLLEEVSAVCVIQWDAVNDEIRAAGMTPESIRQLPGSRPLPGITRDSWRRPRR